MALEIDVVGETYVTQKDTLINAAKVLPNAVRCGSVRDMVSKLVSRSNSDTISLLRIIGHGNPGIQWVSGGLEDLADKHQRFNNVNAQAIYVKNGSQLYPSHILRLLTRHFEPNAVVQLHGCKVGQGIEGKMLVKKLAQLWNVTVQAGLATQWVDTSFQFEGKCMLEARPTGSPRYTNCKS